MYIQFLEIFLFFMLYFNHCIFCLDNDYYGTIVIVEKGITYKSYNITLHPSLNYPYLLKYNVSLFKLNNNNFMNKFNDGEFYMYFLDSEESIINLILNKTLDSLLSYNYLIVTSYNPVIIRAILQESPLRKSREITIINEKQILLA